MEINKIIIGLEVHIELKTLSKMFCGCRADHFAKEPNTQTCPVCLGLPGALPVPNSKAIDWTILLGLSLGGSIPNKSQFDRKNYFYPDLPKGYQISQYQHPFSLGGKIKLESGKEIKIKRVHLEEDTAKLIHEEIEGGKATLIDFNRSGVALVEIVSEPDANTSDEAKEYLEKLQQVVRYLGISDADMEKGSMRCEPNINLEIKDGEKFYYTPIVELKNINSFRFAKKAIDFEIKRQFEEFIEKKVEKASGNKQTRGWNESKQVTYPQREKEEANDYRYFPEPDIPSFFWTDKQLKDFESWLKKYEMPWSKKNRFEKQYGLNEYQSRILTEKKEFADFFEKCVLEGKKKSIGEKEITNVIINKKSKEYSDPVKLIDWISAGKTVADFSPEEIEKLIDRLLSENSKVVESCKKGKTQALGLIVGLIKKETGLVISAERILARIK